MSFFFEFNECTYDTKSTQNLFFILQQVLKMEKGTWFHFSLHLESMKMKQKVIITLFHGCDEYEKDIK